jgi:hypothetical protein
LVLVVPVLQHQILDQVQIQMLHLEQILFFLQLLLLVAVVLALITPQAVLAQTEVLAAAAE